MNEYAQEIIEKIRGKRNAEKALWLENYVKHEVKSYGVGIPEIREIIHQFEKDKALSESPVQVQIEFLDALMNNEYTEPKLAAILFIQLYWNARKAEDILNVSSAWFDNQWIRDWNVCDWLCVRLLTPILDKAPETAVPAFREWNKSQNLWKARASLVPFAQSRHIERHAGSIQQFSAVLIKREERFCKTAVGWVLREYSKTDQAFVRHFLAHHKEWATKEVIKNASKYFGDK